jgi:5-methylthioribose kinase
MATRVTETAADDFRFSRAPDPAGTRDTIPYLIELTEANALDYLEQVQGVPRTGLRVSTLAGGVSNTVLLIEGAATRLVLKQSLGKLRVAQEWFSSRSRIRLEYGILERLADRMTAGSLPRVLFRDPENFLFAMTAAPPDAETWKDRLLRGDVDPAVAERVAEMLVRLIRAGRELDSLRLEFASQSVFDELRLDPYYRATAVRHPDLAPFFEELISACHNRAYTLVHGDWSPKNFLLSGSSILSIDWEVIHVGDPAFDAAFLSNHLVLKCLRRPVWSGYYRDAGLAFWRALRPGLPADARTWFESAAVRHLAGLLLARVDGKSPVEYLQATEEKERARELARSLIAKPPAEMEEVFERVAHAAPSA